MNDVLLGTGMIGGTRRCISQEESWSATGNGVAGFAAVFQRFRGSGRHMYGFDNTFFACVSAKDGKKNGAAATAAARSCFCRPEPASHPLRNHDVAWSANRQHKDWLGSRPSRNKTWNHPVVAHGKLFVRNGGKLRFDVHAAVIDVTAASWDSANAKDMHLQVQTSASAVVGSHWVRYSRHG